MRFSIFILLSILVVAGCATNSIAQRKKERAIAFAELSSSQQMAIEEGRLLPGMSTNAAYIAWGKPTEITSAGTATTWLYHEQGYEEEKHTTIRVSPRAPGYPEESKTLYARKTLRRSVTFEDGLVRDWNWARPSPSQSFR